MPDTPVEVRHETGITRVLFDTGTLFHLYIGRWTGNKKMHERDLLLDEVDPSAMYIGHKKLLPKEAQESLQRIEGLSRSFLANRSVPFPIGNARYVAFQVLRQVLDRLQVFKNQWNAAVEELLTHYPSFQEKQLDLLDRQAKSLAEKELSKVAPVAYRAEQKKLDEWVESQKKENRALYPSVKTLREKFAFEWRMFRLSPLDGLNQMTNLDADTVLQEQARVRQDLNKWVSEVSVMMHKELGEAAAQAKKLLEENGKLNPKNLRPLFEAFETFNAVNFVGASSFMDTISSIRSRFLRQTGGGDVDWQLTAEQVNHSTDEMRNLLATMADLAVNETAEQAGLRSMRAGNFGRVIDLS